MRNLSKMLSFAALTLVATLALADGAFAANDIMSTALSKTLVLFRHIKTIVFVVGAFGLIGIAFQAIFGKVKWTWFAGLAVGLAILAAAGAIVNYATGGVIGGKSTGDTFGTDTGAGVVGGGKGYDQTGFGFDGSGSE